MYTPALAGTEDELKQIAALSRDNLRSVIDEAEKRSQGFLTWEYTENMLAGMTRIAPSVIVKQDEQVVGYALTALKATASVQPELTPMIAHLETLSWKGKPVSTYRYYMMGQICIARAHRGKGVFDLLYGYHRTIFQPRFDLLLTEVSTSNYRSLKAHLNTGFAIIDTHNDHLDEWAVVAWDWSK
jgi:hypothetical protein